MNGNTILALAKAYTNNRMKNIDPKSLPKGSVGHSDITTLTFDGDSTDKEVVYIGDNSIPFVKISNGPIDTSCNLTVTYQYFSIVAGVSQDTVIVTHEKHDLIISQDIEQIEAILVPSPFVGADEPLPVIFSVTADVESFGLTRGTYVLNVDMAIQRVYVSEIKLEIIHPIDPKFIPGVVLPVVEITTAPNEEPLNPVFLTSKENAALNEAAATGLPCVAIIKSMGCSVVCMLNDFGDGDFIYAFSINDAKLVLQSDNEGDWQFLLSD